LKKQTAILLTLLTLAMMLTAGCGDSHSVPPFTQVAFLSNRTVVPVTNLFSSKLDGTSVTPVPLTGSNAYYASLSADAKKVAFYLQSDAWVQNADGTGVLNLTTNSSSASEVNFVRISPNAKQVIYGENNDEHLHIINVDGTGDVDLTPTLPTGMTDCYSAGFSSDNKKIAFVCEGAGVFGIYTVKPDGTGTTTVTATRTVWTDLPSFTPDGKKIVFVGFDTTNSVYDVESVSLDSSGNAVLVSNTYEAVVLNSTLYYTFNDTNLELNQVYKASLDGTNAVSISDGLHDDYLGLAQ